MCADSFNPYNNRYHYHIYSNMYRSLKEQVVELDFGQADSRIYVLSLCVILIFFIIQQSLVISSLWTITHYHGGR